MNKLVQIAATSALSIICITLSGSGADAKRPVTITQRIEAYQAQIKRDIKTGDLTKKEADDMQSKIGDVNDKIGKMKEKNGGKLSYKDEGKVEKSLNDIEVRIKKLELDKRVTSK